MNFKYVKRGKVMYQLNEEYILELLKKDEERLWEELNSRLPDELKLIFEKYVIVRNYVDGIYQHN